MAEIERDWIPILCRQALERRVAPGAVRRRLRSLRRELDDLDLSYRSRHERWAGLVRTRRERLHLRSLSAHSRRQVAMLARCLAHLERWLRAPSRPDLVHARIAWDFAEVAWRSYQAEYTFLAPDMVGREGEVN